SIPSALRARSASDANVSSGRTPGRTPFVIESPRATTRTPRASGPSADTAGVLPISPRATSRQLRPAPGAEKRAIVHLRSLRPFEARDPTLVRALDVRRRARRARFACCAVDRLTGIGEAIERLGTGARRGTAMVCGQLRALKPPGVRSLGRSWSSERP